MSRSDDELAPGARRLVSQWAAEDPGDDPFRDDAMVKAALQVFDREEAEEEDDEPTDVFGVTGPGRYWPVLVAATMLLGSVMAWRIQEAQRLEDIEVTEATVDVLVLRAMVGLVVDVVEARPVLVELDGGRSLGLRGRGLVVLEGVDEPVVRVEKGRVMADWQVREGSEPLEVRGAGRRFTQTAGEAAWTRSGDSLSWDAITATVAAKPVVKRVGTRPPAREPAAEPAQGTGSVEPDAPPTAPRPAVLPPPLDFTPRRMAADERLFGQALSAARAGTGDSALLLVTELTSRHPDSRWTGPAMIIRADALSGTNPGEAALQYRLYLEAYPDGHEVPALHPGNLRDHARRALEELGR